MSDTTGLKTVITLLATSIPLEHKFDWMIDRDGYDICISRKQIEEAYKEISSIEHLRDDADMLQKLLKCLDVTNASIILLNDRDFTRGSFYHRLN